MSDTGDKGYAWEVVDTRQTIAELPSGSIGPAVEVTFRLSTGDVGKVMVPVAGFSQQAVRDAIDRHAAELAAVSQMRG